MPTTLTPAIALAHERLTPRVTALLRQVERTAARKSDHPVPPATLATARAPFAQARKVLGREAPRFGAAETVDLGALAVGLGQLAAGLEAFEAAHSGWSGELRSVAWNVAGASIPVSRLKPHAPVKGLPPIDPVRNGAAEEMRRKLGDRLLVRENARYMQGYRDALAGRPPHAPFTEIGPVPDA